MNNDTFFTNLITNYPNLSALKVSNNTLYYENRVLPLNNFNIASLFYNYGDLAADLSFLTCEDLWTIIYIHTIYYKDIDKFMTNFQITTNDLKYQNAIKFYQTYLFYLLKYQEYLNNDLKDFLNTIELQVINNEYSEIKSNNDYNETFYKINEEAEKEKTILQAQRPNLYLKKEEKKETNIAGYINAFVFLLTFIFVGLIISVTLLIISFYH